MIQDETAIAFGIDSQVDVTLEAIVAVCLPYEQNNPCIYYQKVSDKLFKLIGMKRSSRRLLETVARALSINDH